MNQPLVTILLSSYNHEKFLAQSIESILHQTYKNFELFIVDDCSSDNSWKIISSYDDKRIVKIRNEVNKNDVLSKDLFKKFNGKYFAINHCDDLWDTTKIEKQVDYLESNPDIATCFTQVQLIDENNNNFNNKHHPYYDTFTDKNMSRQEWIREFINNGNRLCHPSCLIRMKVQLKENLFTAGLGSLPDFYRWVKLCLKHQIYIYPEKLTLFRVHQDGQNVSGANKSNLIRCQNEVFFLSELFFRISDDDLFLVFPDLINYKTNNQYIKDFVIAKGLCKSGIKSYKLAGLSKIYQLLQDDKIRQELDVLYSYNHKSFFADSGMIDVFNAFDETNVLHTSVFSGETDVHESVYCFGNTFRCEYDIKSLSPTIRFDPDEGVYRKFSDIKAFIDGNPVEIKPVDTFELVDNDIYYYTMDPKFEIYGEGSNLIITGKTYIIDYPKVQAWHDQVLLKRKKRGFRKWF